MSGWLLIFALLVLGGLLSTLGDRLGTRVGKARLSIFKLRPRTTAVFITVLTGSFISAISLGLILMVSRQLRVGLFELDDLQKKLQESRLALVPLKEETIVLEGRIQKGEQVLNQLQKNIFSLRRGNVVINSGQYLAIRTFKSDTANNIKDEINELLNQANLYSYLRAKPGEKPNKRILYIRQDNMELVQDKLSQGGDWVVIIRSVNNVLRGDNYVIALADIFSNKIIINQNEVLARLKVKSNQEKKSTINNNNIQLLLYEAYSEAKKRGSVIRSLQVNPKDMSKIAKQLQDNTSSDVELLARSIKSSYTSDPISISLEIIRTPSEKKYLNNE